MNKVGTLLFLFAETHLHPGTGTGVGQIDRAVQRDRATALPIIQTSSVKGSLKSHLKGRAVPEPGKASPEDVIFGKQEFGGAAAPVDARLLLLPVRSLKGVFVWITCPYMLELLRRDCMVSGNEEPEELPRFRPGTPADHEALVASLSARPVVTTNAGPHAQHYVVLDDFTFTARQESHVGTIAAWLKKEALPAEHAGAYYGDLFHQIENGTVDSSLVIVSNDVFRDFTRSATEIVERNTINEKGTSGNLWTEEHLPANSLLYSPVLFSDANTESVHSTLDDGKADKLQTWVGAELAKTPLFQIGADESLGRGLVRARCYAVPADAGHSQNDQERVPVVVAYNDPPAPVYEMREQARSFFAAQKIGEVASQDKKLQKEYRSLVRGLPAMLQKSGLPATVAFLLAEGVEKGKIKRANAKGLLYAHLQQWICDDGQGDPHVWASPAEPNRDQVQLFDNIRTQSSDWLRQATRSIEGVLGWQKRMAEAFLENPEQGGR